MNRTCAPQLGLADFVRLASAVGVSAVEVRNDIAGRELMDGTAPEQVRGLLAEAGLAAASVNALQRFNHWTAERMSEARSLFGLAARLGAPGVVLCPEHAPDHGWSPGDAERNLREGLKMLRPMLRDFGIKGYVEPLGMGGSTLKHQVMAVAAVGDVDGWDVYELCFDTFQFFRCGDIQLFPERIGLVHISGITRQDLAPGALVEPDRELVEDTDRVGNITHLAALRAAGYRGHVSMEPFNPSVQQSPDLLTDLKASFARVRDGLRSHP